MVTKVTPVIKGSEETVGIFVLHFIGKKTEILFDLTQSKKGNI